MKEEHNFKNRKSWQKALNCAPNKSWIKQRKLGFNKKSYHVPIQHQQALADIFFDEFDVIDERYEVVTNEILCTVKISVLPSYPNAEHRSATGTGAKPIQAKSGSTPEKFPKGKISNSLEYCAPAARTAAISNMLSTFGNVFGRNLNRKISSNYNMDSKKRKKSKK